MSRSLKLRQKILLLPSVAAVGFLVTLAVILSLGRDNDQRLARIEAQDLPAMDASRELETVLALVQRGFQDAVAASDPEMLTRMDELRRRYENGLGALAKTEVRSASEIAALETAFASYYTLALGASRDLISVSVNSATGSSAGVGGTHAAATSTLGGAGTAGGTSNAGATSGRVDEQLVEQLQELTRRYNAIHDGLTTLVRDGRARLAGGFAQTRAANARASWIAAIITCLCLAGMLAISWMTNRRVGRQLAEVAQGCERIACGDFSREVVIHGDDELGDMGRNINRIGVYLRGMAKTAAAVAAGEFGVAVPTGSDRDSLGLAFREMAGSLNMMAEVAACIAGGDLRVEVTPRSERDTLGAAQQQMVQSLGTLVRHVHETVAQISAAATELAAGAAQHERGASEQSSAVEETRRTMGAILSSGEEVGKASELMLRDAEKAQASNRTITDSLANLGKHTQRISEILEVIKEIANKSELLALNAALEGTKAGDAGRGFSLVASQMQRLAESVMSSVRDIKALTSDIRDAMSATVGAAESGKKLADQTTESARQIGLIMQQYRGATEQVSRAMDEIAQVALQSASASRQILDASHDLQRLSQDLGGRVGQFRLPAEGEGHA